MEDYSGSLTALGTLFTADLSGRNSIAVQVTSAGSATISYEGSNDGITWSLVAGFSSSNPGSVAPITTSTGVGQFVFPAISKYFRARVSSYTSGTVSAIAQARTAEVTSPGVFANNAVASAIPVAFSGTVTPASSATGAMTKARIASAASTNATSVKGTAGRLYELHVSNPSAAIKFLKLYNKATAPTVGTDTPTVTIPIAANGGRVDYVSINGQSFSLGIGYAITGAVADTDTTAVAANDVHGELIYV